MKYDPKDYQLAYSRFKSTRARQRGRKKIWNLTFDQWMDFWFDYGEDKNDPNFIMTRATLGMYLIDQNGAYEIGNVTARALGSNNRNSGPKIKGLPRPTAWKIKDPNLHRKYMPWLRARAQAAFRKEPWTLTFDDWCEIWPDELWNNRGRGSDQMSMTRIDQEGIWEKDNIIVVTRRRQLQIIREHQLSNGLTTSGKKRKN